MTRMDHHLKDAPLRMRARGQRQAFKFAAAVACLALALLILSKSMLVSLSSANPELAAAFATSSSAVRFALANQTIAKAQQQNLDPLLKQQATDLTSSALRDEPFNAQGLEMMGLLAASDADFTTAERFMFAASRQSLRRHAAAYWNLKSRLAAQDYAAAAGYADALLRTKPQSIPFLISTLVAFTTTQSGRDALEKLLAKNPPWRWAFFWYLKGHIKNPYVPLRLLLALQATSHPPTSREVGAYLRILLDNKLYPLAHYSWLQFLSADELTRTALLNNGSFESPPSGLPYDWTINSGNGATIEITPRDDRPGEHALAIELGPGRAKFQPPSQLLALSPGRYTLTGMLKGSVRGHSGLIWKIGCLPNAKALAKTEPLLGERRPWTRFTVAFEVPKECTAQTLELALDAHSASEATISGFANFDELKIARD